MKKQEPHLIIYKDRSVLIDSDGSVSEFIEGSPSAEAKTRSAEIKKKLKEGYLEDIIKECYNPAIIDISEEHVKLIEQLVSSMTSEVGRALVALTLLQLTIKSINPKQSIRLHKSSSSRGHFSWVEGISMRPLDKHYITPLLRRYGLLRLNADGFMMTRTLAENYPYTKLYKAQMRGGKEAWINIVELIESNKLDVTYALKALIVSLIQKSNQFKQIAENLLALEQKFIASHPINFDLYCNLINEFVTKSGYSARIFEIVLHSFFQTLDQQKVFEGYLVPLSQMRSANKKHGNIGDIEISYSPGGRDIIESWDAKYGKPYLREELEELDEKLADHPNARIAGFVTDCEPNLKEEITQRISEIESIHNIQIYIMPFKAWIFAILERYEIDPNPIGPQWLNSIIETITLKRTEIAPIDEPTNVWIEELSKLIE